MSSIHNSLVGQPRLRSIPLIWQCSVCGKSKSLPRKSHTMTILFGQFVSCYLTCMKESPPGSWCSHPHFESSSFSHVLISGDFVFVHSICTSTIFLDQEPLHMPYSSSLKCFLCIFLFDSVSRKHFWLLRLRLLSPPSFCLVPTRLSGDFSQVIYHDLWYILSHGNYFYGWLSSLLDWEYSHEFPLPSLESKGVIRDI